MLSSAINPTFMKVLMFILMVVVCDTIKLLFSLPLLIKSGRTK